MLLDEGFLNRIRETLVAPDRYGKTMFDDRIVAALVEEIDRLRAENQRLGEEVARLKGLRELDRALGLPPLKLDDEEDQ